MQMLDKTVPGDDETTDPRDSTREIRIRLEDDLWQRYEKVARRNAVSPKYLLECMIRSVVEDYGGDFNYQYWFNKQVRRSRNEEFAQPGLTQEETAQVMHGVMTRLPKEA